MFELVLIFFNKVIIFCAFKKKKKLQDTVYSTNLWGRSRMTTTPRHGANPRTLRTLRSSNDPINVPGIRWNGRYQSITVPPSTIFLFGVDGSLTWVRWWNYRRHLGPTRTSVHFPKTWNMQRKLANYAKRRWHSMGNLNFNFLFCTYSNVCPDEALCNSDTGGRRTESKQQGLHRKKLQPKQEDGQLRFSSLLKRR